MAVHLYAFDVQAYDLDAMDAMQSRLSSLDQRWQEKMFCRFEYQHTPQGIHMRQIQEKYNNQRMHGPFSCCWPRLPSTLVSLYHESMRLNMAMVMMMVVYTDRAEIRKAYCLVGQHSCWCIPGRCDCECRCKLDYRVQQVHMHS